MNYVFGCEKWKGYLLKKKICCCSLYNSIFIREPCEWDMNGRHVAGWQFTCFCQCWYVGRLGILELKILKTHLTQGSTFGKDNVDGVTRKTFTIARSHVWMKSLMGDNIIIKKNTKLQAIKVFGKFFQVWNCFWNSCSHLLREQRAHHLVRDVVEAALVLRALQLCIPAEGRVMLLCSTQPCSQACSCKRSSCQGSVACGPSIQQFSRHTSLETKAHNITYALGALQGLIIPFGMLVNGWRVQTRTER